MRCSGLALSRGTVPPIAQRPLRRSTAYRGRNLNRRSGCPDHQRLRSSPCRVGQSFLIADGPGLPPRRRRKVPLRRWLRVPPLAGGRGFPFAGWLGASSHLRPEISPCRVAPGPPRPVARGFPLPVAPGPLKPVDLRCPVAGWLRIPPGPKARRYPLPGGSGLAPRRWPRVSSVPTAPGFPCARGREEIPLPGGSRKPSYQWPEALPLPVGSGVSPFASGLGFPLRRLPFPVVKKFLRLFVRGAQEVCTSNFKILWPSTSHPQLTPGCPPRQTFLHRILHSAVHRPAGLGNRVDLQPRLG